MAKERRLANTAKAMAKAVWKWLTAEPPQPPRADLIQRDWSLGIGVPDSLKFQWLGPNGFGWYWPVMLGHRPYSRFSEVFRFKVWPGMQTTDQFKAAVPLVQSAMGLPIWCVADVPEDANCVDLYVGYPPSFEQISITQSMLELRPAGPDWSVYLGWDMLLNPVRLKPVNEAGVLVSGAPNSGKTTLMLRILKQWHDAGAEIQIADFSGSGNYDFFRTMDHTVCTDMKTTAEMLKTARQELKDRQNNSGTSESVRRCPLPLHVVVINGCEKLDHDAVAEVRQQAYADIARKRVRELLERGHAYGVFVCLITATPEYKAVSELADLCKLRISGYQTASGAFTAALGLTKDELNKWHLSIPADAPGRMILVGQEANPVQFQTAQLPDR